MLPSDNSADQPSTSHNGRIGVIAVIQRRHRFLAIRRSATVRKPGRICFPGGSMISGESEQETLIREMREELSVNVAPLRRLHHSRSPWGTQLFWWSCHLEPLPRFELNREEIAELMWMTLDEMLAHEDLLESNHSFLELLRGGELIGEGRTSGSVSGGS